MSTRATRIATAKMIKEDMIADAHALENMPFDGENVGPVLGKIMAGIAGLAYIIGEEMEAQQARVASGITLPPGFDAALLPAAEPAAPHNQHIGDIS